MTTQIRRVAVCKHFAGPDSCYAPAGHDGDHWTYWGKPTDKVRPVMYWRTGDPWDHQ